MSKSNSFENQLLLHLFNNSAIPNIGDANGLVGAGAAGNLFIRLHTDAAVVNDSSLGVEAAYTGYVPGGVAVPRSGAGWNVVDNNASNAGVVTFGACTVGSENIRYFSIWKNNSSTNDSERIYWGQLTSDLAVAPGITPEFGVGDLDVNED